MSSPRGSQSADSKTIHDIIDNYVQNEKALVNQLYFKARHGTTIGGFREDIWREMFEQIVPKKFVVEQSVFIIDSKGRVSNEVDLAILDETYTPYIFHYGRLKFLPIEAVAVVVECKSTSLDQRKLKNWAENIAALTTSCNSYTRTINKIVVGKEERSPTQTATRPLRILCCLNEQIVNDPLDSSNKMFDFVIRASEEEQKLRMEIDNAKKNLREWYLALNHVSKQSDCKETDSARIAGVKLEDYEVSNKGKPVSLLTFNLQLNQLLMLINNPILFPHEAYAEMFNKYGMGGKSGDE
ncbi:MAG: DUF6602 domain-containing protein [Clostridiaceae bacterium]|nr:DUF6602 domain-containing protein [Clostridiaceae bacterium]